MILCTSCSKENKDSAKFCTGCGNNISSPELAYQTPEPPLLPTENKILCHQCGRQNKENAKYCVGCGNSLAPSLLKMELGQENAIHKEEKKEDAAIQETPQQIVAAQVLTEKPEVVQEYIPEPQHRQENLFDTNEIPDTSPAVINEKDGERNTYESINTAEGFITEPNPILTEDAYSTNYITEQIEEDRQSEENAVSAEEITEDSYPPYPEKRSYRSAFWITGILILAAVGIGALFYFQKSPSVNSSGQKPNTNNTDSFKIGLKSANTLKKSGIPAVTSAHSPDSVKAKINVNSPGNTQTSIVDNFKYLAISQITTDLFNKQLCEGLVFTGKGQKLSVAGFFPDIPFQKRLLDNDPVTITVNVKDPSEDKSCTVELFYKKDGNKFHFENYAEK